ncbi:MAG: hypothetical protein FJ403_10415 [Verrucomicrobia bacterium]|nr:hypothetical protein [Verrucomicrobiota bacterium]
MKEGKSSISKAKSYIKIGGFWDNHDLADYWVQTKAVQLTVALESEAIYYGVEKQLSKNLAGIAKQRGVSSHTLVNLWLQQKLDEAMAT